LLPLLPLHILLFFAITLLVVHDDEHTVSSPVNNIMPLSLLAATILLALLFDSYFSLMLTLTVIYIDADAADIIVAITLRFHLFAGALLRFSPRHVYAIRYQRCLRCLLCYAMLMIFTCHATPPLMMPPCCCHASQPALYTYTRRHHVIPPPRHYAADAAPWQRC